MYSTRRINCNEHDKDNADIIKTHIHRCLLYGGADYLGKFKSWRIFLILGNKEVSQACDVGISTFDRMK